MSTCYRILHLDDAPLDAQLVELALEAASGELCTTVTYVRTREEFLAALDREEFDIILSDYRMPGFDGDEALKVVCERRPEIPFIMVTGELGEERVIETLQRGATDYVLKGRIFRLVPAIKRALADAENRRRSREIEEALRAEHQRSREILESIGDAFYSVDRDWHFTYVNHHAEILWGKSAGELLGKRLWEAFHEAAGSDSQRRLLRAMQHRVSVHYEAQSPVIDAWIEVHAYPSTEGGLTVYFRDVTERKRTEEALRKSEERFRLIADTMPVMVWTADARGIVDYGNLHSREYAGIPAPARAGEPPSETPVHPDDAQATQEAWQRSVESGEQYEIEHRLRRVDGTYRWHLSRAVPVRNDRGTIIKWYGTATDIQEIREAHQELERRVQERTDQLAAANRELEAFTSSVSHDLKAPLRIIEAFSAMLASRLGGMLGKEERKMLDGISQNVRRMDSLIGGLLQFSRLAHAPLMVAPVHMKSLAQSVMEDQQIALGLDPSSVRVVIDDLPVIQADPTLMRQVLANLFSNALKFSRKASSPRIDVGAEPHKGGWLFYVRDNGIGFPRGQAGKLFRMFQRLHPAGFFEGTGVGLANVKRIIERHGGEVCAEGMEGKGATFFFSVPASTRTPSRPGA